MCRYSLKRYRSHYVCIKCRIGLKRYIAKAGEVRCGRCGGDMIWMGHDFHTPKSKDVQQWRTIELLVQKGINFHSCGC